jgi:outer membrane immunogenic protein
MKNVTLAAIAIAALSVTPAFAADMASKAPVPPDPGWTWAGSYGGVSLGARVADTNWTSSNIFPSFAGPIFQPSTGGSIDSVAARIGGYFGYNWTIAPAWIFGLEADIGWAANSKTVSPAPGLGGVTTAACGGGICTNPPNATAKVDWDGSLRARIGSLVTPNTLVFATGGFAWQSLEIASSCVVSLGFCSFNENESVSRLLPGWTAGVGLEQKISARWVARIEYLYAEFATFNHQFFAATFVPGADDRYTASVRPATHTVDVGIAYKF